MKLLPETENQIKSMHYPFFGCFAQQRPEAFVRINELLNLYNFKRIIEIGTHDGGLSILLSLYCYLSKNKAVSSNTNEPSLYKNNTHHKDSKDFYTFDLYERDLVAIHLIKALGGNFYKEDCFESDRVEHLIKNSQGRCLILCDGGSKINEVNTFIPFLRRGDFIMGHDYFRSEKEEDKYLGKIWYGKELSYSDIAEKCKKFNIKEHKQLDDAIWFCGEKM